MSNLTHEEKRALKSKERLLYTSGQFPLFNASRLPRSGLSRVATAVAILVAVLVGLAILLGISI